MTVSGAISRVNKLKPNNFDDAEKVRWLSEVDGEIRREIIETHEGAASFLESRNPADSAMSGRDVDAAIAGARVDDEAATAPFPWGDGKPTSDPKVAGSVVLFAEEPYSRLYEYYLESQIARYNGETVLQSNATAQFEEALASWRRFYNRTHMPYGEKTRTIYTIPHKGRHGRGGPLADEALSNPEIDEATPEDNG